MDEALRLLVPKLYQDPGAIHLMASALISRCECCADQNLVCPPCPDIRAASGAIYVVVDDDQQCDSVRDDCATAD